MQEEFWDHIFNFIEEAATTVGMRLLDDFGAAQATQKADGSLITQSDSWADHELRVAIATEFPDHGILSEEGDHIFPDKEWCWIIDPLDATTNFTRGIPIWGISIGLLYRGTPVFGYVYLPPLDTAFHGFWYGDTRLKGPQGAFLNDQPITPCLDEPSSNHFFNLCSRSIAIATQVKPTKIRMLGMAAYNFLTVAAGSTLGGVEATPKIWDIAAAWVIAQAAGAVWVPLQTEPLFPLQVGKDYGKQSYPTLVVSREALVSMYLPWVQSLRRQE